MKTKLLITFTACKTKKDKWVQGFIDEEEVCDIVYSTKFGRYIFRLNPTYKHYISNCQIHGYEKGDHMFGSLKEAKLACEELISAIIKKFGTN